MLGPQCHDVDHDYDQSHSRTYEEDWGYQDELEAPRVFLKQSAARMDPWVAGGRASGIIHRNHQVGAGEITEADLKVWEQDRFEELGIRIGAMVVETVANTLR
jgi:hypothetical protein